MESDVHDKIENYCGTDIMNALDVIYLTNNDLVNINVHKKEEQKLLEGTVLKNVLMKRHNKL